MLVHKYYPGIRGNITMVVDRLEKAELVVRKRDPGDRRRKLIESYFPIHAQCISRAVKVLTREEQLALSTLCRKLGLGQKRADD